MSNSNNNNLPKLSPEQIKQFMTMQQQQGNGTELPKKQQIIQNIFAKLLNFFQNLTHSLDRFINFVSRPDDKDRNDVIQAARYPILFGLYVIIFFVVFGFLWSALAPLDSAAIATGILISNTNKKIISHQEGGILKAVLVKPGDKVKAGDRLIELDDTRIRASYENKLHRYKSALAAEARLIAERDNLESIVYPEFLINLQDDKDVVRFIHTQENIFRSGREKKRVEKENNKQKIAQLNHQIEGFRAKKTASRKNLEMIRDRLKANESLMSKGYANKSNILELQSKEASLLGDIAITDTEIAKTQQDINRTEIEFLAIDNTAMTKTLSELKDTQVERSALGEDCTQSKDVLDKSIVKSPVDGIVSVVNFHTIGSVIPQSNPILEISPSNDHLIIEAKVQPKNIDSVHEGLVAKIKFSAFKARTTPLFHGKVISISPDIVQDRGQAMSGQENTYYIARIELDMDEFNKIATERKLKLQPGMSAEIQIVTGTRTLLRYLLDPVIDTAFKAFKEK